MSLSKRKRFEVFKRDEFTCQYCGQKTPKVILEVDHVHPKSKGGSDDLHNLLTACFDCNRGKSNKELSDIPPSVCDRAAELKEKRDQLKEYNKWVVEIQKLRDSQCDLIADIYWDRWPDYSLKKSFIYSSVRKFIDSLGLEEVSEAMHYSLGRVQHPSYCIKYFCGVCWGKIRENG